MHSARVVHHVQFAIRSGWRAPEERAALQVDRPLGLSGFRLDPGKHLVTPLAVQHKKVVLIKQRRADIAAHAVAAALTVPQHAAAADVALRAGFERVHRRALGRTRQHHSGTRHRRGHQPPVADARRVPRAPAPEFRAAPGVVPRDAVAPGDENFLPPAVRKRHRRAVRLERLGLGPGRAVNFPQLPAGFRVEPQDVRLAVVPAATVNPGIPLQHLQIQRAVVEQRAARRSPLIRKLAVLLLNVLGPHLFAVRGVSRQHAVAVVETHELPVRHRRRRGIVAPVVLVVTVRHDMLPLERTGFPVVATRHQLLFLRIRRGHKNMIPKDNRCCRAWPRHRCTPDHALSFAELGRQILLLGGAVVVWPTPVPPFAGLHPGQRQPKRHGP